MIILCLVSISPIYTVDKAGSFLQHYFSNFTKFHLFAENHSQM